MIRRLTFAAAAVFAASAPAFAHLNPAEHGSMMAGLSHPLFGADHILAMVAVGLWASQLGGRGVYAVPAAFVGVMSIGFLLGRSGLSLPLVEPMIAASVVVLGLLVAAAVRLPVAVGAAVVGGFALFHGYAHSSELGSAGALSFAGGFLASTALLHLAGVGLGLGLGSGAGLGRSLGGAAARLLGVGTAVAGLALMAG